MRPIDTPAAGRILCASNVCSVKLTATYVSSITVSSSKQSDLRWRPLLCRNAGKFLGTEDWLCPLLEDDQHGLTT